ncbi:hypothetical protein AB6A40_011274 [Gnathostoma spinigerum]|uniref:ShKT domain-containing protein n=1 Tax=Gnathostoma spinigerum TaxID=75299 RepID=A0ABD6EYN2_9BILA
MVSIAKGLAAIIFFAYTSWCNGQTPWDRAAAIKARERGDCVACTNCSNVGVCDLTAGKCIATACIDSSSCSLVTKADCNTSTEKCAIQNLCPKLCDKCNASIDPLECEEKKHYGDCDKIETRGEMDQKCPHTCNPVVVCNRNWLSECKTSEYRNLIDKYCRRQCDCEEWFIQCDYPDGFVRRLCPGTCDSMGCAAYEQYCSQNSDIGAFARAQCPKTCDPQGCYGYQSRQCRDSNNPSMSKWLRNLCPRLCTVSETEQRCSFQPDTTFCEK